MNFLIASALVFDNTEGVRDLHRVWCCRVLEMNRQNKKDCYFH